MHTMRTAKILLPCVIFAFCVGIAVGASAKLPSPGDLVRGSWTLELSHHGLLKFQGSAHFNVSDDKGNADKSLSGVVLLGNTEGSHKYTCTGTAEKFLVNFACKSSTGNEIPELRLSFRNVSVGDSVLSYVADGQAALGDDGIMHVQVTMSSRSFFSAAIFLSGASQDTSQSLSLTAVREREPEKSLWERHGSTIMLMGFFILSRYVRWRWEKKKQPQAPAPRQFPRSKHAAPVQGSESTADEASEATPASTNAEKDKDD